MMKYPLDNNVCSTLIQLYSQCDDIQSAKSVFSECINRDVGVFNSMIQALRHHSQPQEAINLFYEMIEEGITPNNISFVCILSACCDLKSIDQGISIKYKIVESSFTFKFTLI